MTSPDGRGIEDPRENVGEWPGSGGPLSILGTLGNWLIMQPLDRLLSGLLEVPPGSFDTPEEIVQDIVPAIIRKVLLDLGDILGGAGSAAGSIVTNTIIGKIPIIGDVVKVVQGISSGLSGALADAAALIGIRWDQADRTEETAEVAQGTAYTAQTVAVTTVFNVTTRRPLYSGLDPTAEPSFLFEGLSTAPGGSTPTQTVVASVARISKIRVGQDQIRHTVSFMASKSGTLNAYADLYRWDSDAATWNKIYSSADLSPFISGTLNRVTFRWSDGYPTAADDQFALQIRVSGSGTLNVASKSFPVSPAPGFSPGAIGGSRNPGSNPAPEIITYAEMESYNDGNTPWWELGSDVGQLDLPRYYNVNFNNYSWQNWVKEDNIAIENGRVVRTGSSDGFRSATYGSPTRTSKARVTLTVLESRAAHSLLIVCRDNGLSLSSFTAPYFRVANSSYVLGVGATTYVDQSPGSSDWRTGAGTYRLSVEPLATPNRANVFVEKVHGIGWAVVCRADNVPVPINAANRFGGFSTSRALFINSSDLDDFILEDW